MDGGWCPHSFNISNQAGWRKVGRREPRASPNHDKGENGKAAVMANCSGEQHHYDMIQIKFVERPWATDRAIVTTADKGPQ